MKRILEIIRNIFRVIWLTIWGFPAFYFGSRRLSKWVKKNKKEQNPNLYSLDERWEYIYKKDKKFIKRTGVNVVVEGLDNLPKGASWIVPNHSSNLDGNYLIDGLGKRVKLISIAKENLERNHFVKGYFLGSDSFFMDRANLRQSTILLNKAANYSKKVNRPIVIFPEGTRSLTTEVLDFKCGSFKFAQKYGLPIVPITITGTLQARRFFSLRDKEVKIIIEKPIKAINHIKLPTDILCKKVREKVISNLEKYENGLNEKETKELDKLKKDSVKREEKKQKKLEQEFERKGVKKKSS